jgi:hypothetical protein
MKIHELLLETATPQLVPVNSFNYHDADDEYVYHVTSLPNAKRIATTGFGRGKPMFNNGVYANYSKGKIFFTDRSGVKFWEEKVENQLFDKFDNPPPVGIVRVPKSVLANKLHPDEIGTQDANHPAWFITASP